MTTATAVATRMVNGCQSPKKLTRRERARAAGDDTENRPITIAHRGGGGEGSVGDSEGGGGGGGDGDVGGGEPLWLYYIMRARGYHRKSGACAHHRLNAPATAVH